MLTSISLHRLLPILGLVIMGAGGLAPTALADPPNIIFIMFDDLGVGELQWYPATTDISSHVPSTSDIQTRYLFSFAQDGMRYTSFYTNGPVCSPTRASILTVRYPHEFGLRRVIFPESGRGLPDVTAFPALLSANGYTTGHFGK